MRPFRRVGRGHEGRERLGVSLRGPREVRRLSRKGRKEFGDPARRKAWVLRPLRRAGKGQESLPEILEGSGRLGGVGSPFRRAGRDWEALLESWKGSRGTPGEPEGVGRAGRERKVLLDSQ